MFHQTHGYWVDGVSPETATLPQGWAGRLVRVANENTGGAIGWCLEPHDLAFSKLAACREKDLVFVSAMLRFKMISPSQLKSMIEKVEDGELRQRLTEAFTMCQRR